MVWLRLAIVAVSVGEAAVKVISYRGLTHETGAMGHELAQRDRCAEGVGGPEVRQVRLNGSIEVDFPALDLLHDGDIGE